MSLTPDTTVTLASIMYGLPHAPQMVSAVIFVVTLVSEGHSPSNLKDTRTKLNIRINSVITL